MTRNEKQDSKRRIDDVRQQGLDIAVSAYPTIVKKLAELAETGSCQHAKLIFELLEPASKRTADDQEDLESQPSLAEILLERLQLLPPDSPDAEFPKVPERRDFGNASATSAGTTESV